MRKCVKIWIVIATSLIVAGGIVFVSVMQSLKWDFKKLSTVKYEKNTYEISEKFSNISINVNTADIVIKRADDDKCKVVCNEYSHEKHFAEVVDDTLLIKCDDNKKWYDYINIGFCGNEITVYLPDGEYNALSIDGTTCDLKISDIDFSGNVKLDITTGDIKLENCNAVDIETKNSTGDTTFANVNCANFISSHTTGDIELKNVIVSDRLSITGTTGDVEFVDCDAGEIYVKSTTGDVEGTLLSDKVFYTKTTTGDVYVPSTSKGGKCEIQVTTGDIEIRIK